MPSRKLTIGETAFYGSGLSVEQGDGFYRLYRDGSKPRYYTETIQGWYEVATAETVAEVKMEPQYYVSEPDVFGTKTVGHLIPDWRAYQEAKDDWYWRDRDRRGS